MGKAGKLLYRLSTLSVMAGLDPAIHVFEPQKTWMPATRAGMAQ
jgi:hypothetical protein